jgi:hypothetical protein
MNKHKIVRAEYLQAKDRRYVSLLTAYAGAGYWSIHNHEGGNLPMAELTRRYGREHDRQVDKFIRESLQSDIEGGFTDVTVDDQTITPN